MKRNSSFMARGRHHMNLGSVLIPVMMLGTLFLSGGGVQAQSGNLEPPASAFNPNDLPMSTTQTQPSWDQALPTAERFVTVMNDEAVLDKNTGLVWEQAPRTTNHEWTSDSGVNGDPGGALLDCIRSEVGGQLGWRLPSIHELGSLLVPGGGITHLSLFTNVQEDIYWSATTDSTDGDEAWAMNFSNGTIAPLPKTLGTFSDNFIWCVRGGGPLSEY